MSGWAAALALALRMGMTPEAFWRLSMAEWRMLTGATAALRWNELAALMARFPDEGELSPCVHEGGGDRENLNERQ